MNLALSIDLTENHPQQIKTQNNNIFDLLASLFIFSIFPFNYINGSTSNMSKVQLLGIQQSM